MFNSSGYSPRMEKQHETNGPEDPPAARKESDPNAPAEPSPGKTLPREIGGRKGPEPTRYGDWEKDGRCIDF